MTKLEVTVEYNKFDGIFVVEAREVGILSQIDYDDPYRSWGTESTGKNFGVVFETGSASDAYCVKIMLEQNTLDVNDLL